MLLFLFLDIYFPSSQRSNFSLVPLVFYHVADFFFFFFDFSQLELKCQWMYLWGALQLFRGFEARSAADRGTLCLWRRMKRLFVCAVFCGSYRRFPFFSFPPQLHLHTFLGEWDEDSAFLAAAGGTNCSRSDSPPNRSHWSVFPSFFARACSVPAGYCFCIQWLMCCWLEGRQALLLRPSPLMSITAAS